MTATLPEISHDFTSIPDAVTAAHLDYLANHEEKPVREAVVEREAAFVFRTRAGTVENLRITIPTITHKDETNEKLGAKMARVYERKYGAKGVEYYEDLKERVGGRAIKFRRIGYGKGCVYQTSDPVVAEFIRDQIATGKYDGLYEDYAQSAPLRSRFTDQTFPNTEQGRIELAQYDRAIEKAAAAKAAEPEAKNATVAAPAARATASAKVKS